MIVSKPLRLYILRSSCLFMVGLAGCGTQNRYEEPELWFNEANVQGPKDFDVFHVMPNCIWNKVTMS